MNRVELAIAKVSEFLRDMDENSTQLVKNVLETVKVANANNIMAQIQVGHIDTITKDISECHYAKDYEVLTGCYRDEDGNKFETIEEAHEFYINKFKKHWRIMKDYLVSSADGMTVYGNFYSFEDAVDYISRRGELTFDDDGVSIKPYYFIYDENACVVGDETGYHNEEEAKRQFKVVIEDRAYFLVEDLELIEPDKIMWNTVWNFNKLDIDIDLAKKCKLAVVKFTRGQFKGMKFLALTGCDMDLSPLLIAYKALKFGYITEQDVYAFGTKQERDYFKHVVGLEVAREVYRALGIEKFFDEDNIQF